MGIGGVIGRIAERLPIPVFIDLKPFEIGLIAHFRRTRHPVAKIDKGQARFARDLDMIEDHIGPNRFFDPLGIVKRIDHAQPIFEHIREAHG
jgi:hypothetical protein